MEIGVTPSGNVFDRTGFGGFPNSAESYSIFTFSNMALVEGGRERATSP
jgi:hypothetical protein